MTELHEYTATELRIMLRSNQVTPTELTTHYLARIREQRDSGAFVTVTPDLALQRAADLEAKRNSSDLESEVGLEPLWGMPHADKDLMVRPGVPTYFGSAAVRAIVEAAPQALAAMPTDPVVELADSVGLVSLGKTNTPEFGLYCYTESAVAPPAVHPLDSALGAGGSSGGAAVAVATGQLPFAIGSDGGGSVRIPAATVGLVGLKPTLGAIPADDTSPEAGGIVSGPLARNAADAALLFEAMSGAPAGTVTARARLRPRPLRIGFATDSPWNPTYSLEPDPALVEVMESALSLLSRLGHAIGGGVSLADPDYGTVFLNSWQMSAAKIPPFLPEDLLGPVTRWLVEEGRRSRPTRSGRTSPTSRASPVAAPSCWARSTCWSHRHWECCRRSSDGTRPIRRRISSNSAPTRRIPHSSTSWDGLRSPFRSAPSSTARPGRRSPWGSRSSASRGMTSCCCSLSARSRGHRRSSGTVRPRRLIPSWARWIPP